SSHEMVWPGFQAKCYQQARPGESATRVFVNFCRSSIAPATSAYSSKLSTSTICDQATDARGGRIRFSSLQPIRSALVTTCIVPCSQPVVTSVCTRAACDAQPCAQRTCAVYRAVINIDPAWPE